MDESERACPSSSACPPPAGSPACPQSAETPVLDQEWAEYVAQVDRETAADNDDDDLEHWGPGTSQQARRNPGTRGGHVSVRETRGMPCLPVSS